MGGLELVLDFIFAVVFPMTTLLLFNYCRDKRLEYKELERRQSPHRFDYKFGDDFEIDPNNKLLVEAAINYSDPRTTIDRNNYDAVMKFNYADTRQRLNGYVLTTTRLAYLPRITFDMFKQMYDLNPDEYLLKDNYVARELINKQDEKQNIKDFVCVGFEYEDWEKYRYFLRQRDLMEAYNKSFEHERKNNEQLVKLYQMATDDAKKLREKADAEIAQAQKITETVANSLTAEVKLMDNQPVPISEFTKHDDGYWYWRGERYTVGGNAVDSGYTASCVGIMPM